MCKHMHTDARMCSDCYVTGLELSSTKDTASCKCFESLKYKVEYLFLEIFFYMWQIRGIC